MTTILSEDVILDLMPLYLGQSASAGTRHVVEEYLAQHPEMAARLHAKLGAPEAHAELATLRRTRHALRQRSFMMAFAIACTLAPLTSVFETGEHGGSFWMMVRDIPSLAIAFWVAAVGFWVGYAIWARRARSTGL